MLTAAEFHRLSEVPPAIEWFANIRNEKTRRAYKNDVQDFMGFVGIQNPEEFRIVTRAHVIAWRDTLLASKKADASIRRALSALSSLFNVPVQCECNRLQSSHRGGTAKRGGE